MFPDRKKAKVDEASARLGRAIARAQSCLTAECKTILDSTIGASPDAGNKSGLTDEDIDALHVSKTAVMRMKKKGCTSKPREKRITISCCKMNKTRKGFKKASDMVEIVLNSNNSYQATALKASSTLAMKEPATKKKLILLRMSGAIIPDRDVSGEFWTIGRYVQQAFSSRSRSNIGIATVDVADSEVSSDSDEVGSVTPPRNPRRSFFHSRRFGVDVLYAPHIPQLGLDMTRKATRVGTWIKERSLPISLMDSSTTWYPETAGYAICSIIDGDRPILNWENGYRVENDSKGSFRVVHLSPTKKTRIGGQTQILYCVASDHNFEYKYQWMNAHGPVGVNSPLFYAMVPGTYQCTITNGKQNIVSKEILVIEELQNDNQRDTQSPVLSDCFEDPHQSCAPQETAGDPRCPVDVDIRQKAPTDCVEKETVCDVLQQGLREFVSTELVQATGNYSELIGRGGFGNVYKGSYHHLAVAVKVLNKVDTGGVTVDVGSRLKKEALALTRFCHPNIIQLMGFCASPPSLIYPYMERLSLFYLLHEYRFRPQEPPNWDQRQKILRDAACGISYLHSSTPPFIHQDIKSQNILLDAGLNAVIADFGFVAPLPETVGSTTVVTAVGSLSLAWSRGYLAPEVSDGKHGIASDVYSYGVVVLETFTGMLAYSDEREDGKLVEHCEDQLKSPQALLSIADQAIGAVDEIRLQVFHYIILHTLQRRHKRRISISQVLDKWDTCVTSP